MRGGPRKPGKKNTGEHLLRSLAHPVRVLSIIFCGKTSSSEARGYNGHTKAIRRRPMGQEKDHRRFEKGRKVHEEQTRSVREEASEKTAANGRRPAISARRRARPRKKSTSDPDNPIRTK